MIAGECLYLYLDKLEMKNKSIDTVMRKRKNTILELYGFSYKDIINKIKTSGP